MEIDILRPNNFSAADSKFYDAEVGAIFRQKSKISQGDVENSSSASDQFYQSVETPRRRLSLQSNAHNECIDIVLSSAESPKVSQPSIFGSTQRSIRYAHHMIEEEEEQERSRIMIRVESGDKHKQHIPKKSSIVSVLSGKRLQPIQIIPQRPKLKKAFNAFKGANLLHTLKNILDDDQFNAVQVLVKQKERTIQNHITSNKFENKSAIYKANWKVPASQNIVKLMQISRIQSALDDNEYNVLAQIQTPLQKQSLKAKSRQHVSIQEQRLLKQSLSVAVLPALKIKKKSAIHDSQLSLNLIRRLQAEKQERLIRSQLKAEQLQEQLLQQHQERMEQLQEQTLRDEQIKEQKRSQIYQKCMSRLQHQLRNKQMIQMKSRIVAQSVAILEQNHQRSLITMQDQWQRNEPKLKAILSKKHQIIGQVNTPNLNNAFVLSNDYVVRSQIQAEQVEKSISQTKMKRYAAQFRIRQKISLTDQKSKAEQHKHSVIPMPQWSENKDSRYYGQDQFQ